MCHQILEHLPYTTNILSRLSTLRSNPLVFPTAFAFRSLQLFGLASLSNSIERKKCASLVVPGDGDPRNLIDKVKTGVGYGAMRSLVRR